MSYINDPERTKRFVAAMGARMMLGDLHKDQTSQVQYTEAELKSGGIELFFTPATKKVLKDLCYDLGEDMRSFCKAATVAAIRKILEERVAANEADEAADAQAKAAA